MPFDLNNEPTYTLSDTLFKPSLDAGIDMITKNPIGGQFTPIFTTIPQENSQFTIKDMFSNLFNRGAEFVTQIGNAAASAYSKKLLNSIENSSAQKANTGTTYSGTTPQPTTATAAIPQPYPDQKTLTYIGLGLIAIVAVYLIHK